MHEISLVRTIFRTLEEQFTNEELASLETIELKIGPLANVEPVLLKNAFEAVTEEDAPQFRHSRLEINYVHILIQCPVCEAITEVQQYRFVCSCGRPCSNVVQGNELLIERVRFREKD
jgi:hydrogenase nickel incorporation protein HypA/HybF